jgi:diguanylate cyclase (GGDEF)-like protein
VPRSSIHRATARRSPILLLVYGICLAVVSLTLVGLAVVATAHVSNTAVRSRLAADIVLARQVALRGIGEGAIDAGLARLVGEQDLIQARLLPPAGDGAESQTATAALVPGGSDSGQVLVETIPLVVDGRVERVLELRRDAAPILADADAARRDVLMISVGAALAIAFLLYLVFGAAQRRIARQTEQLMRGASLHPLTGLRNHGSIVSRLEARLEAARGGEDPVAVAMIDIDDFHLLNGVHGEEVGDQALLLVAGALEMELEGCCEVGHFGADEFLLIAESGQARDLETAVTRVRERLAGIELGAGPARLPVRISAGIAHFPFHARSATDLLAAATVALGEAKGAGGDATRVSGAWSDEPRPEGTLGILQSLVASIEAKDRYTRRHSDDVARYAAELVDRSRAPVRRETVRLAALIHDVGKIGVPDDILRKPSRLTPHEEDVVQQHVLLGDLMARDLPDLAVIRAGVRHHHERWDGTGYPDGLAGERIPLIARILAVADAYSAMTTTRPYRKALSEDEALGVLQGAAGTELDPALVRHFVEGRRTGPGSRDAAALERAA